MGDTFGEKWWPTALSGKANADIQAMTYAEIEVLKHEVIDSSTIRSFRDKFFHGLFLSFSLNTYITA